jgi:HK97 family phage major capsid protein
MAIATEELDKLRSVEELANFQKSVEGSMADMNSSSAGLPFTEVQRSQFADLKETREEIVRRVQELEARKAVVEAFIDDPKRSQKAVDSAFNMFDKTRPEPKERDIYDLSKYQFDPNDPARSRSQWREGAKRAIDLVKLPTAGAKFRGMMGNTINGPSQEDLQAHLEYLLDNTREGDMDSGPRTGAVARHILATGGPVYRRAFWKHIVSNGNMSVLDREEQMALQRALSLTGSQGGFAIPFALDPSIIPTSNSVVNPSRAIARLVTISGANTWQGVTSPAVVASYAAEGTEATDNSTTLVQPQATVQRAQVAVPFSIEVSEDWPALEQEFGRLIQDSKDDLEGVQFVTGVGSTVFPQGFAATTGLGAWTLDAGNSTDAATGLSITAANVYALEAALPPRFRPRESFVANRAIYNKIRGIDTAGGAALWLYMAQGLNTQAPTPGNTGATLLGRGAWEASAMNSTIVDSTLIMMVGDFSYFLIVDRIGMTVELIPHLVGAANRLPVGMRALYAYWRNTSKVLSTNAFAGLVGET